MWGGGGWVELGRTREASRNQYGWSKVRERMLRGKEGRGEMLQNLTGQNKMFRFYSTCVGALNFNKPLGSMCAVLGPELSPEM